MIYKLKPCITDRFKLEQILDMLRYCDGTLLTIKSKNKVNGKLIHNVNFKLLEYERNHGINVKTRDRFYFDTLDYCLLDIKKIEYLIVESKYMCEVRWYSFGYIIEEL